MHDRRADNSFSTCTRTSRVLLGALLFSLSTSRAGVIPAIALGVILECAPVWPSVASKVDPNIAHVTADPVS